jgi:hypothetical protein
MLLFLLTVIYFCAVYVVKSSLELVLYLLFWHADFKQNWSYIILYRKWFPYSNMTSFFRFVNKRARLSIRYNLISTCASECDWLFHWQHKLCATFSANVNINYRLPIKVYYRICTLRHIRIEINHGSQNVFWALTWIGRYY